ncbi:hypothetical protein LZ578_11400 [Jeotgalibaca sp. MA1X17-3]|uniref:hypothetical protein n=1 Tax=Jeotgalibaca sp. MA1X17-3 TaxID=2908211 RepID=UPI001F3B437D|nr:hypothetical protein [Jeotgalibaca sp. MA1X17-3]UJF15551.1 hypothetical protein LZ578_11400 [Jeotgalibaca sp. MA1X17-3]
MKKKILLLLGISMMVLVACTNGESTESKESSTSITSTDSLSETVKSTKNMEERTITFLSGVDDKNQIKGDKNNFYALKGVAEGFDKVTAIIEGTAIDFRNTDQLWQFDFPYRGPSVETKVTFTTDSTVKYGQTGIDLDSLNPKSYVTVTFIPNKNPEVEEPSAIVNEGEKHTFRNEENEIVEVITITNIEVVDADPELNPLGEKLLKVELFYANEGTKGTYMAPNYYSALDSQKCHLPLRYSYFWLKEILPGESFTDIIYYDVPSEGPYTIQFFDGAWLDLEEENDL